jgi:ABC-type spermidine/putrescine transport system permease subunit I
MEASDTIVLDKSAPANLWQRPGFRQFLLLAPALVALLLLFVYPVSSVFLRSIFSPDFTLKHYLYFFETPLYGRVLWITFQISWCAITPGSSCCSATGC